MLAATICSANKHLLFSHISCIYIYNVAFTLTSDRSVWERGMMMDMSLRIAIGSTDYGRILKNNY